MNWKYEDGRIYSTDEESELMAEVTYIRKGNAIIDIEHVYVNPTLRGQGVAGQTMMVVAEHLRNNGLKATASCSYANAWFKRNEELYSDIMAEEAGKQVNACKINGKH